MVKNKLKKEKEIENNETQETKIDWEEVGNFLKNYVGLSFDKKIQGIEEAKIRFNIKSSTTLKNILKDFEKIQKENDKQKLREERKDEKEEKKKVENEIIEIDEEKRKIEARFVKDKHIIQTKGTQKLTKREFISMGILPENYDIVMLETKGIDYFKEIIQDYFDITWAEFKTKINLQIFKKILDLTERDLKEIWINEKKETEREQKEMEKEYNEKNKSSSKETINGNFIFDKDKLVEFKTFSFDKIGNNIGYGLLLPKDIPIYSKKGEIVGRTQIRSPAILTSDRKLIEPTKENENEYRLKYTSIPSDLKLRIDLKTIQEYLSHKNKKVNGKEIFESIKREGYEKFIYFHNKIWYDIHTLWDIGTYFFQLFNTYPILELRGLSGTAKSKTMNVSRLFTLNPSEILINPSESSIFRLTDTQKPTKYFDEAEKLFEFIGGKLVTSPLVELINSSYSKGGKVLRTEKVNNQFLVVSFDCYSPTMIGSINGLRGATETRSITNFMIKSADKDSRGEIEVKEFENLEIYQEIRNKLYLFALENWKEIETSYNSLKEIQGLKRRDFQLWKPLLAISKVIDNEVFERVLEFSKVISRQKREDFLPEDSLESRILEVLRLKLQENMTNMTKNTNMTHIVEGGKDKKLFEDNLKKIYINFITTEINKNREKKLGGKTISTYTDKLGFREYRYKDMAGSYIYINQRIFESITHTLIPEEPYNNNNNNNNSSYSSYSSQNKEEVEKDCDENNEINDEKENIMMNNIKPNDTYDTFSNQDTLNTPQSSETEYEEQQQDINTPIEQPKPTNQGIKHRCFKCQGQNPTFTSDGIRWYCKNCVYSGVIV